jgi:hypothetical protein
MRSVLIVPVCRVYQTFTRAIFEGASNLAVFGGDANEMLIQRIPPQSLHNVFVNYPEPPQQLGGENSQGKHLLTAVRLDSLTSYCAE